MLTLNRTITKSCARFLSHLLLRSCVVIYWMQWAGSRPVGRPTRPTWEEGQGCVLIFSSMQTCTCDWKMNNERMPFHKWAASQGEFKRIYWSLSISLSLKIIKITGINKRASSLGSSIILINFKQNCFSLTMKKHQIGRFDKYLNIFDLGTNSVIQMILKCIPKVKTSRWIHRIASFFFVLKETLSGCGN